MQRTRIEWVRKGDGMPGFTWNPIAGCSPVSAGCDNCYARRMARKLRGRFGYPADEPFRVTLHPERLREPFYTAKHKRIFVCSMGDLFHPDVPDDFLGEVFFPMYVLNVDQVFILLTKRPERMRDYLSRKPPLPPTVWLGVSCENQAAADERIPLLLQTPAAVRWVSVEPMLGPVDLEPYLYPKTKTAFYNRGGRGRAEEVVIRKERLDWVVCGGETGPGARPMDIVWVRSLKDQCQAAGVPFFLKQMIVDGRIVKMPQLDGRVWDEYPDRAPAQREASI